jgi:sulfur-oxidizing protein SoxY
MLGIGLRLVGIIALAVAAASATGQRSWAAESVDPWPDLVRDVFAGRPLADGTGLIAIEMPARAEDAGIVPVTLSVIIPPGDKRVPVAFTLVIGSGRCNLQSRTRRYHDLHARPRE